MIKRKVDVIVPVYNVKLYLEKCIDSLINQSFEDYNILLVDDGATDGSGEICDKYHLLHPNKIYVFHKANGGLSDARNYGVKQSLSTYIAFVDSDDYVDKDYLLKFINCINKYNCDIAVSDVRREYVRNENSSYIEPCKNNPDIIMDHSRSMLELCQETYFPGYATSKMYLREFVEKVPFPYGKIYEDSYTIYKIFSLANKVVYFSDAGYFYLQREGSIQRSNFERKHLDLINAVDEMINFLKENHYSEEIVNAGIYKLFRACHITLLHAMKSELYEEVFSICKSKLVNYKYLIPKLNASKKETMIFHLMCSNSLLYRLVTIVKGCLK